MAIDVAALRDELLPIVKEGVMPFLQGEAQDLHEFALGIVRHYALAIANGEQEWSDEIKAQVKGLIELARIRAEVAAVEMLEHVLGVIFKVAVAAIGVAIKG